ncbi:type IV pili system adhesin PilY [Desulfosarcina ovata subsp. sediminis]|uniref:Type IV pili system adhesin PilY n=1 Tax=Desulfosarcina ovata subsp. sediminis TaxID=885957 RepID=A0A5K7ZNE7_9BACT|nr:PilC/PilY family type IV pilus protein [Desulfosarcina ovata]BBO80100.1 type IV pili system adhesin PilY [Desulfosarcina ovata subsp. sediminis]
MKRFTIALVLALFLALWTLPLHADDTDIYGGGSVAVEPNILIIFDTSGSMSTEDVPGEYYDPATTYTGTYTSDAVYQWTESRECVEYKTKKNNKHGGGGESSECKRYEVTRTWEIFADSADDLICSTVKDELVNDGTTTGAILGSDGGYECGGTSKTLYMGNWLNYDNSSTGEDRSRIEVAQEVITNLIQNTDGVRFGLMRFNSNGGDSDEHGGRVIKAIDSVSDDETYRQELITAVNSLTADGRTPLAETLAEAGLYFAGTSSWFNSNYNHYSDDILTSSSTYTSPMEYRCQKNYIIFMTDGEPSNDSHSYLQNQPYINGDTIGDYDQDGNSGDSTSDGSSDYLDDVAKYLYDNDCNPNLGSSGDSFETQNIITYTIGFQTDQQLLLDTAINGGGEYYVANSISGLSEAFESIISKIQEVNAVFVSPVVPVSRMNRTFAGDSLYVGFFKPQQSGRWAGNIKKYGLDDDGTILDATGMEATNSDGSIKDNARSYWSTEDDGADVMSGGVGGLLLDNSNRTMYTYLGTKGALTDASNAFSTSNADLTATLLGVSSDTEKTAIINDIIGSDSDWKMGDVLHSQPLVVHYDTNSDGTEDDSYIFVGTNGGVMHAFKDSDGSETWAFIPPLQLSRLQLLSDSDTSHDYFIDGAPVVYESDSQKILLFGERRGGYNYYALDITTPTVPIYQYKIGQTLLSSIDSDGDGTVDGADAYLGQSWATPTEHKIKTSASTYENVFLIAGGYDTNQDLETPVAADTVGRAVFTVDVTDGTVSALNLNAANLSGMNNCITDAMGFDNDNDTYTDRVYAGDLGGNIWALEDHNDADDTTIVTDGSWSGRKLFSDSAVDGVQRKIFYAPDVLAEKGEDMIFFGTGDRADPEETDVVNRIYAVRNNWAAAADFETLTENDLVDVTSDLIQLGTVDEQEAVEAQLDSSRGWYFELENPGEKIISSVVVYAGVLYFTTYTPESEDDSDSATDPCTSISGRGTARLYAVDYETGASVYDYSSETETNTEDEVITTYGKKDRCYDIGTSIPSSPVIAISGEAVLYIGVEGGIQTEDALEDLSLHRFYWRQAQ